MYTHRGLTEPLLTFSAWNGVLYESKNLRRGMSRVEINDVHLPIFE